MKHDGFLSCTYGEKLIKDDNGLKNIPLVMMRWMIIIFL